MTLAPATSQRRRALALRLGTIWLIATLVALPAREAFACSGAGDAAAGQR